MTPIVQVMHFTKSTKGTHFYEAPIGSTAKIRSQYIQKDAFEGQTPPQQIRVTVEAIVD